ncbi:MAG: peptidylprolyl isomerase [Pirellulaceae bacterium]
MSKEARQSNPRRLLTHVSWVLGTLAVIAIIVIFRNLDSESAHGQTTPRRTTNVKTAAPSKSVAPNGVVAVVNGQQITRDQLAFECMRRFGPDVLSGMITTYLVRQECTRKGIRIGEDKVNAEVARVAESFGLTATHWITLLETERNVPEAKYRNEIIWPQLALQALALKEVEVTDKELKELFDARYGPKIKTRVIMTSDATKARQLLELVNQNPEIFGQVAKDHSEDSNSAAARGLIPPIGRNMGSPEIENAAFALNPGQISGIVQVADQFFILKCESIIPQEFIAAKELPQIQQQLREQVRSRKINSIAISISTDLENRSKVVRVFGEKDLQKKHPQTAALINGRTITLTQLANECFDRHAEQVLEGEINRTVLRQEVTKRNLTVTQRQLDEEIRRAAETYGYFKKDQVDVNAWLEQVKTEYASIDVYIRDAVWPSVALKNLVEGQVVIAEKEMAEAFESNYGPRIEVLAIVMKNERKALEVWEMANGNRTEQFFGELAADYSIEPTSRANDGRVAPIRRHGGSKAIEDEAFKLRPGEISGLIGTGDTYIILFCLGETEPIVTDINDVRDELTKELHERALRIKMGQYIAKLMKSAKTQSYLPKRTVVKKTTRQVIR